MGSSLTRTEVCQLLGVSPKSLYLWERDDRIPCPRRDRRNWRVYSPKDIAAIRRFLGQDRTGASPAPSGKGRAQRADGLSARNQLVGTIIALRTSGLLCEVVLRLGDGQEITSVITESSGNRLGLRKGREATAIIKATEVMILR
ncbi:MAG: TOBE domain-containing protein [candidate division Zixibacteria bacterium]|nr:TOBE domain-containing protein [candidate division Zixibacteria bacterium]